MTVNIGVIGLGEAGREIAVGLCGAGARVLGNDVRTKDPAFADACLDRGLELRATPAELVAEVDVVLCLTSASSALAVLEAAAPALRADQVYADLNSAGPELKRALADRVSRTGAGFADVAVMEAVPGRGHTVPLLASGSGAVRLAELVESLGVNLEVVDGGAGAASAIKMCRSILVKGVEGLLLEFAIAALPYGVTDRVLASMKTTLGADWRPIADYMLRRSLVHGARRSEELRQAAAMMVADGAEPLVCLAAAERIRRVAETRYGSGDALDAKSYPELLAKIIGGGRS